MRILRDLIVASRTLRRSGALPVVVVLMLSTAIGAATAIFSIADAVLLRPLPLKDPDGLVVLWGRDDRRSQQFVEVGLADLRAWRDGQSTLTAIEVFGSVNWGKLQLSAGGEPFGASQNFVSAGFFDLLGARPILGRTFRPADDIAEAPGTVILSENLWRERFSADPTIVGRSVRVGEGAEAGSIEIIGVMGSDFRIPAGAEVWLPAGREMGLIAKRQKGSVDGVRVFYALGRLRDGVTVEAAAADLSRIAAREEVARGQTDSEMAVVATPIERHLLGPARPALIAIGGACAVLLLIACANAGGLLLAHGTARRRDVAVRLALGARRSQVVRQFMAEAAILAGASALIGLGLAFASFDALVALAPIDVPRLDEAAIHAPSLVFALIAGVVTALVIGLLPAWQCTGADVADGLQHSRGGTVVRRVSRLRKALVAAQLAAAVVLLTAAGLLARSFVSLLGLDLGFDPRNVLVFEIDAPKDRHPTVDTLLERVAAVPGVVAAGAIHNRPFAHGPIGMDSSVIVEGQPLTQQTISQNPILNWEPVTPGYFRAMDIRVLHGRMFDDRDHEKAPRVVIVSESLAARLWPGESALGKRILTEFPAKEGDPLQWQTVVGVVEDARYRELPTARFDLYLAYKQVENRVQYYSVRTSGDPMAAVAAIRTAIANIDPVVKIANVSSMTAIVGRATAPWRFSTFVFTLFSVMSLAFAVAGLAAVVAYAVTQRTREIGVRVALGAERRHVVRLMLKDGLWVTVMGLLLGVPTAWFVSASLSSLLFGVSPTDGLTFAGTAIVFACVSMVAAYLPARKAATVEPVVALRSE
jgi:putative ABC transport system permease protein